MGCSRRAEIDGQISEGREWEGRCYGAASRNNKSGDKGLCINTQEWSMERRRGSERRRGKEAPPPPRPADLFSREE